MVWFQWLFFLFHGKKNLPTQIPWTGNSNGCFSHLVIKGFKSNTQFDLSLSSLKMYSELKEQKGLEQDKKKKCLKIDTPESKRSEKKRCLNNKDKLSRLHSFAWG